MIYNPQYDTQRAIQNPALYNSPIIVPVNNNISYGTNDPSSLCLSGNAFTMKTKGD